MELQTIKQHLTPFYLYDTELLKKTLSIAKKEADHYKYIVHYAMKANSNDRIMELIHSMGFGIDSVSGNEIKRALQIGFKASDITFAGVGKTDDEIKLGIEKEVFSFNVESIPELEIINTMAIRLGKIASIALRINPNIDANTHSYITTGTEENKFGINIWEMDEIFELLPKFIGVKLIGLHFHIGSQITDMNVFKNLCLRVNQIQEIFIANQIIVENINVGGGLGINYHEPDLEPIADFKSYFAVFKRFLDLRPNQKLHFELGRSLVAPCGNLISKVLYIKKGAAKQFAIIDASMTDLLRPALYQSFHYINALYNVSAKTEKYDVVGPVCESTDIFRKAVDLPKLQRGDYIAIRSVGAYGQVMSSNYNLRDKAGEIYVD